MTINYLILAHKNFNQLDKLIEVLDGNNIRFYVHIDKKVNLTELNGFKFLSNSHVKILARRYDIKWGGFNIVASTLSLIKASYRRAEKAYYVLLSGQDFPIKTDNEIYNFLEENYGREYIDHFSLPHENWPMNGGLGRIHYYWFIDSLGMDISYKLYFAQFYYQEKRPYFNNLIPHGGSQWWCLTNESIEYILKYIKVNKIILKFYENTYIPDEMFFQTILLNSPFAPNILNDNLRYIVFPKGQPHPEIVGLEHYDSMLQSDKLWARKFDLNLHPNIIFELTNHFKGEKPKVNKML